MTGRLGLAVLFERVLRAGHLDDHADGDGWIIEWAGPNRTRLVLWHNDERALVVALTPGEAEVLLEVGVESEDPTFFDPTHYDRP